MILDRLKPLMHRLTDRTVFAELLAPVQRALAYVRQGNSLGRVLSLQEFITLGVLRHLQGMTRLREQVQALRHLDPGEAQPVPLARSTWSDALSAPTRLGALKSLIPVLVREAHEALPDRLADIPGLPDRPVRAIDGTHQRESAHFRRRTPKQGGEDNPKGHALLSFYNLRLGLTEDVYVATRSRHETLLLRDYDRSDQALTHERRVLWLVDRAFIDAPFWDAKKRALGSTLITRMKSNLRVDSTEGLPIDDNPLNAGVECDLQVTLASSPQLWRIIRYRTRRGHLVEFLTNDFDLQPGLIAFLYSRRWDEEKCFYTWKNDFSQAKAWQNHYRHRQSGPLGDHHLLELPSCFPRHWAMSEEKALRKQDKRQRAKLDARDGTDRPDWAAPPYRYTSKVSRQVLRFLKYCFLKPASAVLYQRELRPMLVAYL